MVCLLEHADGLLGAIIAQTVQAGGVRHVAHFEAARRLTTQQIGATILAIALGDGTSLAITVVVISELGALEVSAIIAVITLTTFPGYSCFKRYGIGA